MEYPFLIENIFKQKIHDNIKLIELAIVQVIGLIKDECCFSTFTFMNTKSRNWLTMHL
jgi:hypothetical protein